MDQLLSATKRDAKNAAREARALLRRGRKVISEENRQRVQNAIDELEGTEDSPSKLRAAIQVLQREVDTHLAFAKKGKVREYVESIGVAILIALAIRSFIFEPFKIPSPSMVPTLLVGDRLYVSKARYGIRIPLSSKYLVQWRKPALGDIVVFEFPRREAVTRDRMGQWIQRLNFQDGGYPAVLDTMQQGSSGAAISSEMFRDGWGTPLAYENLDEGTRFTLRSAGPDKKFGTDDDITEAMVQDSFVAFPDLRRPDGQLRVHRCPVDAGSLDGPKTYIKRIVGLPGDVVELRQNKLFINGAAVPRTSLREDAPMVGRDGVVVPRLHEETLFDEGPTYITRTLFEDEFFGPVTVPEGQFLAIGDNRDESSDGRCWGFVPISNIKGQAKFVLFSVSPNGGFEAGRFFSPLQ